MHIGRDEKWLNITFELEVGEILVFKPNSIYLVITLNLSRSPTPDCSLSCAVVLSDYVFLHSAISDSEKCFIAFLAQWHNILFYRILFDHIQSPRIIN
jgi:hypothetical protein